MKKKPFIDKINEHMVKFKAKQLTLEQLEPIIVDLGERYNDLLYDLWKSLMTIEMQLFEQCEVRFVIRFLFLKSQIGNKIF